MRVWPQGMGNLVTLGALQLGECLQPQDGKGAGTSHKYSGLAQNSACFHV